MTAKDYAIKLLSFCDRSEKEIKEKILKKGYSEDDCEAAVAFCYEYGYLDDRRYALRYVHDASCLKRHGKIRIRMDLKMKGVAEDIIDEALESVENEAENLRLDMEKRFGDLDFTDPKVKNRVFGYFQRRGFMTKDILFAMNEEYDGYDE